MSDSVRMTTPSESPEVKRGREGKDTKGKDETKT